MADLNIPAQLLTGGDIAAWNEWRRGPGRQVEVVDLTRADLSGADLAAADLSGAYLTDADLSGAYLTDADLSGAYLTDADLSGANLTGANLTAARLPGADLSGAYLSVAILAEADLTRANLSGAILSGAILSAAFLAEAVLTRAFLAEADLTGAYLSGANLYGARLAGANLAGAELSNANMTGVDLTGADLRGANLTQSYLTGADLTRADLTRADLAGADLSDTDLSESQRSTVTASDFGFELDEIEAALRTVAGSPQAVAVVRDNRICGYIVPANPSGDDVGYMLSALRQILPEYLVPEIIVQIDAFPLRPSGRIDRGALPEPIVSWGKAEAPRRADEQVFPPRVFVGLTELRIPLPDGIDPSELAQIVEAFAALARLVVKVGVDITPPNAGPGSAGLAVATQSPGSIEITTRRLHYGSDLIVWFLENWQLAAPGGGLVGVGGGFTIRDLLKRHDSKILGLLYTIFTSDGRQTYKRIKQANDQALLAEAINAAEKSNAETLKHRADGVEHANRYRIATEKLPAITHEQARKNTMGAAHLTAETQAGITASLGTLEPITSRGLTATTVIAVPDDDSPKASC
ncbi:pentapeptide repeat-containing protein [Gordonia aquimaris]|uniref:Pentapeptide repeat-containing protein n=1 Tax=Gordonia aquimaris TaxID=2984863 RepID=A0A9X3I5W9_9ACTN|nr:pentapeptide repeat-containing protein [Gordonia aquimaris]MCX2966207.1 pentapeptide repeat-containing protein [Gordonia aquimaris]